MIETNDVKLGIKEDEKQFEYDPFKQPADLKLALRHGEAKKVYRKRVTKDEKGNEIPDEDHNLNNCVCCGLPVGGTKIPLTAGIHELYHLGTGFALYFKFIKYSIGILVLIMLVMGVFSLVTNVHAGDCVVENQSGDAYCIQGYILSFTIANKKEHEDYLFAQAAVNFATVIIVMFFFQYLRYQFRKTEVSAENANITPSDYTIVINGIPPEATQGEIEQWLEGFATPEQPIRVARIIKPCAITNYFDLKNQEKLLLQQKEELQNQESSMTQAEQKKLQRLDSNLTKMKLKLKDMKDKQFEHTSVAYVTFETAFQSDFIQKKFKKSLIQTILKVFISKFRIETKDQFKRKTVEVKRAPEPTDIMWENLGASSRQRRIKSAITNFASAILILLTFGVVILVNWAQDKAGDAYGKKAPIVQFLSFVGSIVICVSNAVLAMTIDYLTRFEKHHTYTHFLQGVAQKLAVAQFVNTALSTIFAELILSETKDQQSHLQAINFYGKGGLLESIYWVFITNAFLTPALTIFDFSYFFKLFQRWRLSTPEGTVKMNQKSAQLLFEGTTMGLPAKYATIIKVMLMTCLYAPAMPFALIYAAVGLVLTYWADKYTLLRRHALPNALDDSLTDSMVEYLEWASCAFSVGNIIYVFSLKDFSGDIAFPLGTTPLVWLSLGVSLFHIIFPMELLNETLFRIKDEVTENKTFEEASYHFTTDYDITNPLTRKEALKNHLIKVQNHKDHKRQSNLFIFKALHSDSNKFANGFAGLKETETEEFQFDALDEYCTQHHHKIHEKPMSPRSPGFDFFSNVNTGLGKLIPGLGINTDNSPLQPQQEGQQDVATPEKSSLLPLPIQGMGSKVPTHNGERFDFNQEEPIVDIGALNFVVPHFQKDFDDERKSRRDSQHNSGDIDPNECMDDRENTAREFSIKKTVFEK